MAGDEWPGARSDGEADDRLLTLLEVARLTGRNVELLRRWCVAGRIPGRRLGRDWFVPGNELTRIERMPRRRVRAARDRLDDRTSLNDGLNAQIDECLDPGERVRLVLPGVDDSAIIATDRKVLLARDGLLVSSPAARQPMAWPLEEIRRVQLDAASASGAVVLLPRDPDRRAIVLLVSRSQLDHAAQATDAIRALLEGMRRDVEAVVD